ncbi:MAG: NADH-quinone oxidoreductase subunit C [Actinomycetota bacterium]|nr:NADH-quinone oxidoreductase subunit C [Actinomycetota bacterium]
MNDQIATVCARLREQFHERTTEPVEELGEASIEVGRETLIEVATYLRDEFPFELLADLSCVDFLGIEPPERRFLVAYHLYSFAHNARLRLRVRLPEGDETCPSVCGVWPTANWQEREAYDFFGIEFEGHPDLRRLFMPDEWEGHPQRKDYPLGGTKIEYKGAQVPPPDTRGQPTTTTGYPGRIS